MVAFCKAQVIGGDVEGPAPDSSQLRLTKTVVWVAGVDTKAGTAGQGAGSPPWVFG